MLTTHNIKRAINLLILSLAFGAIAMNAEDLVLAKDGKTDYQIVIAGNNPKNVWDARFLAWFLKEKTGAEFPVRGADVMLKNRHSIFLGDSDALRKIVGPLPYAGMKDQDHIVKSVGEDILLYGKGYDADFYAVSEFLDRCLGFRFYQRFVVPEIVKTPTFILKPFDYHLSWALTWRYLPQSRFSDYFRGENVYSLKTSPKMGRYRVVENNKPRSFSFTEFPVEVQPEQLKVCGAHTAFFYLPTKHSHHEGYPFIENRDYFETNPEFYAVDKNGKSRKEMPCFGTQEMRREFTKNIEKHFDSLGTDNVEITVSYPDGCAVCECPTCLKLQEKYGTPGGAYFEYLLELGEEFMKTHPRTKIRGLMYQKTVSQIPPTFPDGKKFPPNVDFLYCDITSKTNHTWDAPENQQSFEWLKKAMKVVEGELRVWTYYAHYDQIRILPFAADNIIVDNIKKTAGLGIKGNFFEFYPWNTGYAKNFVNFSDLNLYLFYRFCKNPKLDYDQEVTDFMNHVYGPAAQLAKQYHDELVRFSTVDNPYGVVLYASNFNKELSYLSPDNIYKWEKMFDEMTQLVENSPEQLKQNVANLRRSLDIAAYGRWRVLQKDYAEYFNNPDTVKKRIGEPQGKERLTKIAREFLTRADMAIKFMGKEKPLPQEFAGIAPEKIKRLVPKNINTATKTDTIITDDEAAFGYGVTIDDPDLPFNFGFYSSDTKTHGPKATLSKEVIGAHGKYKLYKLGEVQPTNGKCSIWFSSKSWCTQLDLSTIFDLTDVNAKYDAWVSLKFPENYKGDKDEVVLCDQIILVRK